MVAKKQLHPSIGVGGGVLGAVVLWAWTNLGFFFFALVALTILNLVIALFERDLLSAMHKWIRVVSGIAIPALVPLLAHSTSTVWTDQMTQGLIAAVFAALLSATIPDIVHFVGFLLGKLGVSKATKDATIAALQAELDHLKQQGQQTASQDTQKPNGV